MPRIIVKLFFLISLCWGYSCVADEPQQRDTLRRKAFTAFANSDFQQLEQDAAQYRINHARFPSGVWKLTFFYLGIGDRASSRQQNPIAWQQLHDETEKWVAEHPASPTAIIIRAIVLENHAWSIRSLSSGASVSDTTKQSFQDKILAARDFLLINKAVGVQDPHWHTSMVRLATALRLPDEEVMRLVAETSNTKPYYYQTYFAAVDHFSPKWGGNAETLDKFVRAVVEQTKDKEGMGLYARIYWAATQSWYASQIWPALVWSDFKQGMRDVAEQYPDDWNLNNFARYACAGKDKKLLREMLEKISAEPQLSVWGTINDYNACRKFAYGDAL